MQSEEIARIVSEVLKRLEKEDMGSVLTAPAAVRGLRRASGDDVLFSSRGRRGAAGAARRRSFSRTRDSRSGAK